jgi:hypothetical protein
LEIEENKATMLAKNLGAAQAASAQAKAVLKDLAVNLPKSADEKFL